MLSDSADVTSNPLSWAILGGEEVGEDIGYGPARVLEPQQVKTFAAALASIDQKAFESKYNPAAMQAADIYLSDMCVRDGIEALEYILGNYRILCSFYKTAAADGKGAILWFS
ncbi:YfbM family protein [Methylomonas methanica]|nr:YfbM family protein [Methylomonas methanica]